MDQDDFKLQGLRFLDWFKSQPGATFHSGIEIVDLRSSNAGRGIVAKVDIPADTVLFTIPREAILSVRTSDIVEKLPDVFEDTAVAEARDGDDGDDDNPSLRPEPLDSWASLILVMMYEFVSPGSRWKPYFDVLPENFDTLMFWTEDELKELQASPVVAKIGRQEADNMFQSKIIPIIQKHSHLFGGAEALPDESTALRMAHRMGSIIMAYAFDLENEDEDEDGEDGWVEDREGRTLLGMVPMADILNADAEFNAHVNHGDDALTVMSLRPIKAGEEILNYYGPHPNSELLRRYGYVSSKHSRYDVVEIPWATVVDSIKEVLEISDEVLATAVAAIDPDEMEEAFVFDRESGEPDSTGLLVDAAEFKDFPPELEHQIKMVLKSLKKVSPSLLSDKRKNDKVMDAIVSSALGMVLSRYGTSIAEDEQLLASLELKGRQRMAIMTRIGEKVLLREALASLDADAGGTNGPTAKKARY